MAFEVLGISPAPDTVLGKEQALTFDVRSNETMGQVAIAVRFKRRLISELVICTEPAVSQVFEPGYKHIETATGQLLPSTVVPVSDPDPSTWPERFRYTIYREEGWLGMPDLEISNSGGAIEVPGPQGPVGPQGETGPIGEQGETGATGPASSFTLIRTETFTADGTWTIQSDGSVYRVVVVGSGAGGASGPIVANANATNRIGGAGAGGGAWQEAWFTRAEMAAQSPAAVVVGPTAPGGAVVTGTADTPGQTGTAGNHSSFGTLLTAYGGGAGFAVATTTTVSGGAGGGAYSAGSIGGVAANTGGEPQVGAGLSGIDGGGAGSTLALSRAAEYGGGSGGPGIAGTATGIGGGNSKKGGGGGGAGGGGQSSAATAVAGGNGGSSGPRIDGAQRGSGAAGGAGSTAGNGTAGSDGAPGTSQHAGGGGGGGGNSRNATPVGGAGGNGGIPGGGGGGGGAGLRASGVASVSSGKGGDGARGEVTVYTYQ